MKFRKYRTYQGPGGWTLCLLPAIFVSASRDYVNVQYGRGLEPDGRVLEINFQWLIYSATFTIVSNRHSQGASHVR